MGRDPDAPSGLRGRDGTEIPNSLLPRGLGRIYRSPRVRRFLAKHFHRAYYYDVEHTIYGRTWLRQPVLKYPTDMWIYQEIIAAVSPAAIVESGAHLGGSALYFATVLDGLGGEGRVISVDLNPQQGRPEHPRIAYLTGSSTDPEVVDMVRERIGAATPVLVILDSAHDRDHVLRELELYSPLVTVGSYLIVEDSNINGHPVLPDWGPGPTEALRAFLADRSDFVVDHEREELMLTAAPGGFLRRVR